MSTLPRRKLSRRDEKWHRSAIAEGWVPLRIRGDVWAANLYLDCLRAEVRAAMLERRLRRLCLWADKMGMRTGRVWSARRAPGSDRP